MSNEPASFTPMRFWIGELIGSQILVGELVERLAHRVVHERLQLFGANIGRVPVLRENAERQRE